MNSNLWRILFIALSVYSAQSAPPLPDAKGIPLPTGATLAQWPKPTVPQLSTGAPSIRSQDLEVIHSSQELGGFVVQVAGKPIAIGQTRPMIGYLAHGELRWLDLANATGRKLSVRDGRNSIQVSFECQDPAGARWSLTQQFSVGRIPGAIDLESQVTVDQDRAVAFLPMLMLFPGAGAFGATKGQGLFAGLEYLENEPSSSEADVIGPASHRQVPDYLKITFPLMAIQHDGRYVGLIWQMRPHLSALFDSPDRLFGSGAHLIGLLYPGSDGQNRLEGSLLPRVAEILHARELVEARATLLGGLGQSVVPALQQYVAIRGLPPLPSPNCDLRAYAALAAGGWLDSKIRKESLVRHAVAEGNFAPGPATDAALWMDWLAGHAGDQALAARLEETAKGVLAAAPVGDLNRSGVGHIRYPVASLVYGHVAENTARAKEIGRQLLANFEADGSVKYHAAPDRPDFAKTHSSHEAGGFAARPVLDLLEVAAVCGDGDLLSVALKNLHALDKFQGGAPRGAQTWEIPLHTPDILASANLVRAYTLGYELSGDAAFLERARYWAWTGVPFVYLVNPTIKPVGFYATIAVFGATHWRAPVWMGLPVQWCGLVYAEALYGLVRHDPHGPWKKLADGITISGIQQTWPSTDAAMQGLLPDSFVLRDQRRNGPAINPATVQACAVRYFGQTPVYDFRAFPKAGLRVHAPGGIRNAEETTSHVRFQVESWVNHPYFVLINGLTKKPQLHLNGQAVECAAPHQFLKSEGQLILSVEAKPEVEISF